MSDAAMIDPEFAPSEAVARDADSLGGGDPKRVIKACTDSIEGSTLGGRDISFLLNKRANAFCAIRQHDRAFEDYAQALQINPNYAAAYFNRAVLNFNLKHYDEALEDFTVAISIDRTIGEVYRGRARVLDRLERYREAVADYTRALQIDRDDPVTLFLRGRSLEAQGRKKAAMEDYTAALALDRDLDAARDALARLKTRARPENALSKRQNRSPRRVIDATTQFVQKESKDRNTKAIAYRNRGVAQRRSGQHAKAVEDFNRSLSLNPESAETYWQRAVTLRMMSRYDVAIDDYDHAIEIDPGYADAYSGRAWALFKVGHHEEALVDADKAIELKPREAIFHDTRGHIYEALQLRMPAINCFRKALQLDPKLASSLKALERLGAAEPD